VNEDVPRTGDHRPAPARRALRSCFTRRCRSRVRSRWSHARDLVQPEQTMALPTDAEQPRAGRHRSQIRRRIARADGLAPSGEARSAAARIDACSTSRSRRAGGLSPLRRLVLVMSVVEQHVRERVADLSRGPERARVVAMREHGAAPLPAIRIVTSAGCARFSSGLRMCTTRGRGPLRLRPAPLRRPPHVLSSSASCCTARPTSTSRRGCSARGDFDKMSPRGRSWDIRARASDVLAPGRSPIQLDSALFERASRMPSWSARPGRWIADSTRFGDLPSGREAASVTGQSESSSHRAWCGSRRATARTISRWAAAAHAQSAACSDAAMRRVAVGLGSGRSAATAGGSRSSRASSSAAAASNG